jgi:hypothetical protein
LTNSGGASVDWTASATQDWVSLSETNGTLAAGVSTTVIVSINTNADNLAPGTYSNTVTFATPAIGGASLTRGGEITINPILMALATAPSDPRQFQIRLTGQPFQEYVIDASADVWHWTAITTNAAGTDGALIYVDPESALLPKRFYRGRPYR